MQGGSKYAGLFTLFIITGCFTVLGQQPVTFALLADLHVSPGAPGDSSLNLIVDEINTSDFSFTVVAGDLTNTGSDAELSAVKRALDKLIKPYYVIPGNHETNWSESAGLTFNRLWGNDRFIFDHNGYLFVGFNTGPFMKMGDGHIKVEDLQWLRRELQERKPEKTPLISFSHYPLAEGLNNWTDAANILKSFGCRVAFCGHGHRLALMNFNGIPGIMGRTALPGNNTRPGYSIVRLRNDSVLVYNKELSLPVKKPVIMLNYVKPDTLAKIPSPAAPDYSVNQVYAGRLFIGEWTDTASIFSGPCLVNDTMLVYGNSMGFVKAISLASRRILWHTKLAGPVYSTPVSSEGIIVLGTVDGTITGLDAVSGRKIWTVIAGRPVLAEGIIDDRSVYIGAGDTCFYRIDLRNGKIIWKFTGVDGLIQGKPAISGSSVVFGAWDTHLYCLDKNKGSLRWKWNNGRPQVLYSPGNIYPVCSANKVFIVAPDRYMTALDLATGKKIWRTNRFQVRESMGASPDGSLVYVKLMNDTVIAVSTSGNSFKTEWAVDGGFGYEHNPCPVTATDKIVIAATRTGMVVAIDPESRSVAWKYKAGNSSVNKVVAGPDNTLWITLSEGRITGIKPIIE